MVTSGPDSSARPSGVCWKSWLSVHQALYVSVGVESEDPPVPVPGGHHPRGRFPEVMSRVTM